MIMQSSVYPRLRDVDLDLPRGDVGLDLLRVVDLDLPLGLRLAGLDRVRGLVGEPERLRVGLREGLRCRASLVHSESKSSSPINKSTKTVFTLMIAR